MSDKGSASASDLDGFTKVGAKDEHIRFLALVLDSHGLVVEAWEASGVMPLIWGVTGHRIVRSVESVRYREGFAR